VSGEWTGLVGESPAIQALLATIKRLTARSQASARIPAVLLEGETGTGKGLVASLLHREGPRARGPFVDVNCAAIPDTLLEAELFGFERGAFTDARQAKPGLFQTAHRGTIFLDEIGLMTPPLQAKLLKVLEERAVRRLGSTRSEPFDVWIISATNARLDAAIREGRFREDLYHRLAVVTLSLPPLRERGSDVLLLAEHFLGRTCAEYGLPRLVLAEDARAKLATYAWPGNVRELANVIERASLMSEGTVLTGAMLQLADEAAPRGTRAVSVPSDPSGVRSMASVEERLILETLTETGWNISKTATQLGIARNTLRARIRKYGLQPRGTLPPVPVSPVMETPAPVPKPAPAAPARVGALWESRRLAVLRVAVVAAAAGPSLLESGRALDMLIEKVEAFGGRVLEISPGSITAAFGFDPVEDAPRRAALAVLAMQKAMGRNASDAPLPRGAIHVVQAQTVRVGTSADIDGDTKRQVWSSLDALLATAEPGAIVVSEVVRPLLERRFTIAGAKLIDYRPTPFELGGQMGRFVGRAHELGFLRDRFETAREGQGQVVALVGEAGIGKSRLLFEFRQGLVDQRAIYLEGHCLSYASSVPYLPILEMTRTVAGVSESDTPEDTVEKVHRYLESVGMDAAEQAPYVLHLLGIKAGADPVGALSPEVIRTRTLETLHALFVRTSERAPLVLAIEDLHWIDPASEEYLTSLVERVGRTRILMVVTYRPGFQPRWGQKSVASQMALQPLAREDSLDVLRVIFGADEVADSIIRLILAKAEGNPFFLEELARAARDHAAGATPTLTVPDTVQEVLLARIDRLPDEERRFLQSAAVIGKDFAFEVLRTIADLPDAAVRRGLQSLHAGEFVVETNTTPQLEYTFKHALTHEVAYASLPLESRRLLHAKTVDAIETLYRDRLTDHLERLAHHAFHGERWDLAVTYLRQAGKKAAARSANREAVASFDQALEALARMPSPRIELDLDLRLELRNVLIALGEAERVLAHLRHAERHARALGDQKRLGLILCYLSASFWVIGDYVDAIDAAEQARSLGTTFQDVSLRVYANTALSWPCHSLGEYRRGIAAAREALDCLPGDMVWHHFGMVGLPAVLARTWLASCLAEVGDFASALTVARDGAQIAETTDEAWSLVSAYLALGVVYLRRGDASDALGPLERGVSVCRRLNVDVWFTPLAGALGYAHAIIGNVAKGLELLTEAIDQARGKHLRFYYSISLTWLAEAHVLAGRTADAETIAREALGSCQERGERGYEAHTLRVLGDIVAAREPSTPHEPHEYYRRALELGASLGMQPLCAEVHLKVGALQSRAGQTPEARRSLDRARQLFRELDMPQWLGKAEAAIARLDLTASP
jgi:DNA-binding NtrC family response regulator/tetratricopeptide (TPR) repeat protein